VDQKTPQHHAEDRAPSREDGKPPWRLLALLMTMTAIGSMSMNILVPAVPRLADALKSDKETVQLTISLFMLGLAFAQLFTGPLSDKFGRRPVILVGFAIATLASLGAIAMSNAAGLIVARIFQAIGGATGVVMGRAIIRDLFGRDRSAQMIGLVASAMALAPMIAPLIGGFLDTTFGWESIFVFAATASFLVLVWTWWTLPETRRISSDDVEHKGLWLNVRLLLGNGRFIGYVLSAALGCGAFFVYVGAGPHIIITMMERSPTEYGVWFIPTAGGYVVGNIITSRLSVRFGVDPMIFWGNVMNLAGIASGFALLPFVSTVGPLVIVLPGTLMGLANGIILPNSIAGAVSVRPQAAGTASGMTGFTQMLFGAAMTHFTGHIIVNANSVTPALLCMLATAIACLVVYVVLLPPRQWSALVGK
jgi:DHA1 family bicyclomycin/chloramphenicol resistance-like MFS transporter